MLIVKSIAVSHVGKVREHNEDAYYSDDSGLWVIADGMGGHASGEVASQLAIDMTITSFNDGESLVDAITLAHHAIVAQGQLNVVQQGMGATIVAAQLTSTGFNLAWVGDSRVYLYEKKLKQLTIDHSFVQELVQRNVLSQEEAAIHPQRNLVVRSLGLERGIFKVDGAIIYPKREGRLLLCSDGVSDYLTYDILQSLFEQSLTLDELSDAINAAILKTEAADNYSFILIAFKLSWQTKWRNKLRILT